MAYWVSLVGLAWTYNPFLSHAYVLRVRCGLVHGNASTGAEIRLCRIVANPLCSCLVRVYSVLGLHFRAFHWKMQLFLQISEQTVGLHCISWRPISIRLHYTSGSSRFSLYHSQPVPVFLAKIQAQYNQWFRKRTYISSSLRCSQLWRRATVLYQHLMYVRLPCGKRWEYGAGLLEKNGIWSATILHTWFVEICQALCTTQMAILEIKTAPRCEVKAVVLRYASLILDCQSCNFRWREDHWSVTQWINALLHSCDGVEIMYNDNVYLPIIYWKVYWFVLLCSQN